MLTRNRRFQHGSLSKRGKRIKMWYVRWWEEVIGPENEIERIRRSEILGPVAEIPRKQAEQLMADLLRPLNTGGYRRQAIWTFRQFVEDRWKPEVFPTVKFASQMFYKNMLDNHLLPAFGETQLRLITRDAVQSFLLKKSRSGLAWKTVKLIRTAFGTVIKAAVMDELVSENVVLKTRLPRRGPVEEKFPISAETVRKVIEELTEPSRSIVTLLSLTGLRIGELLALRWQDVDLQNGFLRVRQTVYNGHFDEPKTKRSKRAVPLSPMCREILTARKTEQSLPTDLVFATRNGKPLDRHNLLHRQLKPVYRSLGIADGNWHWLRHANATLHASIRTPLGTVQALLGHSSSEITREVYIHSVPADAERAVNELEKLIGPKRTQVSEVPKPVTDLIH